MQIAFVHQPLQLEGVFLPPTMVLLWAGVPLVPRVLPLDRSRNTKFLWSSRCSFIFPAFSFLFTVPHTLRPIARVRLFSIIPRPSESGSFLSNIFRGFLLGEDDPPPCTFPLLASVVFGCDLPDLSCLPRDAPLMDGKSRADLLRLSVFKCFTDEVYIPLSLEALEAGIFLLLQSDSRDPDDPSPIRVRLFFFFQFCISGFSPVPVGKMLNTRNFDSLLGHPHPF